MQKALARLPTWKSAVDGESEPRLQVILDSSKRDCYTAGDRISGRVVLQSNIDEDVKQVTIQFHGRANIIVYRKDGAHGTNTRYHGKSLLFDLTNVLYQSHYTLRANTMYEWPFAFQFPSTTQRSFSGHSWDAHPSFKTAIIQSLPPTYSNQYRSGLGGEGYDCLIEYKLTAQLMRPGAASAFKPVDDRGYIFDLVLPYMPVASMNTKSPSSNIHIEKQLLEVRSLLLLPENVDRSLTLKEKTKSRLRSGSLPSVALELTVETVKSVRLGDEFPLAVSVRLIAEQSSTPLSSPIILESIKAAVLATTHVRSEKRLVAHESRSTRALPCQLIPTSSQDQSPSPFTKATDHIKSFTIVPPSSSQFLVPTFTTFNIDYHHRLKTTCVLACVDKKTTVVAEHEITLVPASDTPLGYTQAQAGSSASALYADFDVLPTYQAATSSGSGSGSAWPLSSPSYEETAAGGELPASASGIVATARGGETIYA